ncbi:MAG: hypothetical protein NZZ41_06445 [Candidatus Dojkabacteria bacterium]|nr:hypothetical protein [Candidatus Dojkabacteria bacterium]
MSNNQLIDFQRLNFGVIGSASANVNCWYIRELNNKFSINGSFSPLHTTYDWTLIKEVDNKLFKSGIVTFCRGKTMLIVKFKTSFKDNNYYIFFTPNNNVKLYWVEKKPNQFTILSSGPMGSEISWLAIHKELAYTTGINNPGSIYAGERIIEFEQQTNVSINENKSLNMENNLHVNLNGWHNNEYIIKPTEDLDNIYSPMNIKEKHGYIILLSSNKNINIFWMEKYTDRFKIGCSFPIANCMVNYMIIKRGLNWWNEI